MMFEVMARAKAKGTLGGERQLRSKSRRLGRLRTSLSALEAKVKRDLRSSDPDKFLTALTVGLMAETGEDPVFSWKKRNVQLDDDGGAYFRRSGKRKPITNATIVRALHDAYEAKEDEDEALFAHDMGRVTADMVGEYLGGFKLSMKDIRGMMANTQMGAKLQKLRAKGPELPRHKRSRAKLLQSEFFKALEDVSASTGLEPELIRESYMDPGLEASYLTDGTVGAKTASSALAERVAQTHVKNELLKEFGDLMAQRPKLSDSRICATLGISLNEAHGLANELRTQLGITSMVSLRDALRQRH